MNITRVNLPECLMKTGKTFQLQTYYKKTNVIRTLHHNSTE